MLCYRNKIQHHTTPDQSSSSWWRTLSSLQEARRERLRRGGQTTPPPAPTHARSRGLTWLSQSRTPAFPWCLGGRAEEKTTHIPPGHTSLQRHITHHIYTSSLTIQLFKSLPPSLYTIISLQHFLHYQSYLTRLPHYSFCFITFPSSKIYLNCHYFWHLPLYKILWTPVKYVFSTRNFFLHLRQAYF